MSLLSDLDTLVRDVQNGVYRAGPDEDENKILAEMFRKDIEFVYRKFPLTREVLDRIYKEAQGTGDDSRCVPGDMLMVDRYVVLVRDHLWESLHRV